MPPADLPSLLLHEIDQLVLHLLTNHPSPRSAQEGTLPRAEAEREINKEKNKWKKWVRERNRRWVGETQKKKKNEGERAAVSTETCFVRSLCLARTGRARAYDILFSPNPTRTQAGEIRTSERTNDEYYGSPRNIIETVHP